MRVYGKAIKPAFNPRFQFTPQQIDQLQSLTGRDKNVRTDGIKVNGKLYSYALSFDGTEHSTATFLVTKYSLTSSTVTQKDAITGKKTSIVEYIRVPGPICGVSKYDPGSKTDADTHAAFFHVMTGAWENVLIKANSLLKHTHDEKVKFLLHMPPESAACVFNVLFNKLNSEEMTYLFNNAFKDRPLFVKALINVTTGYIGVSVAKLRFCLRHMLDYPGFDSLLKEMFRESYENKLRWIMVFEGLHYARIEKNHLNKNDGSATMEFGYSGAILRYLDKEADKCTDIQHKEAAKDTVFIYFELLSCNKAADVIYCLLNDRIKNAIKSAVPLYKEKMKKAGSSSPVSSGFPKQSSDQKTATTKENNSGRTRESQGASVCKNVPEINDTKEQFTLPERPQEERVCKSVTQITKTRSKPVASTQRTQSKTSSTSPEAFEMRTMSAGSQPLITRVEEETTETGLNQSCDGRTTYAGLKPERSPAELPPAGVNQPVEAASDKTRINFKLVLGILNERFPSGDPNRPSTFCKHLSVQVIESNDKKCTAKMLSDCAGKQNPKLLSDARKGFLELNSVAKAINDDIYSAIKRI